jgi:hypothetical protein
MRIPEFIRVAGQLYKKRVPIHPEFLVHAGYVYRKAQTGSENVAAIEAFTKLSDLLAKISEPFKDKKQIFALLNGATTGIKNLAVQIAKSDRDAKVDALKGWPNVKSGLSLFAEKLKEKWPSVSTALSTQLTATDNAVSALTSAEGLDVKEFTTEKTPVGVPSKTPSVDWGEYAQKPQQQHLQASAMHDPFLIISGVLYRPLLPLTDEARAWAMSKDPSVVAERAQFPQALIQLLSEQE